jgi:hypothetical protein
MKGVTSTDECVACVKFAVAKAIATYEGLIRKGVKKLGMENAAEAGASSTVMAILNRVLVDEQVKILADTSCCSAMNRTRKRRQCVKYALPPIQVERP